MSAIAEPRPLPRFGVMLLGALALSGVLAASAHIAVPFWPVPMTMQPLAVILIAGLVGPRLAVAAYVAYLLEGAAGLAVFAGTPARGIGLAYMAGPTGGYLAGQLLASFVVGWLIVRFGRRPIPVALAMVAGIACMYALGVAWLSGFVGWGKVVELGVAPFLAGDAAKIGIATAAILALRRLRA